MPPRIDVRNAAFFFDLDGTLAPLAQAPDAVTLPERTVRLLDALAERSGGSVAVVSGRALADLDRLLAPSRLPLAGLHGAEWRDATGRMTRLPVERARIDAMVPPLRALTQRHAGLLLEVKEVALAVHYRNAPQHEAAVRAAMDELIARHGDAFVLQPGKMVFEIKPRGASKGAAMRSLMRTAPFSGRTTTCFAGDDLTDESGFETINAWHGMSIKVGAGPTLARWRVPDVDALADWLASLLEAPPRA